MGLAAGGGARGARGGLCVGVGVGVGVEIQLENISVNGASMYTLRLFTLQVQGWAVGRSPDSKWPVVVAGFIVR